MKEVGFNLIKWLFAIISAIIFLYSCKKNATASTGRADLLTKKYWVVFKNEGKVSSLSAWEDDFPFWNSCKKDDRWIFMKNLSLELNDGMQACSGSNPNQINDVLRWNFLVDETKLQIENKIFTIDNLDENTLIITTSENINGSQYKNRISLKHE